MTIIGRASSALAGLDGRAAGAYLVDHPLILLALVAIGIWGVRRERARGRSRDQRAG